MNSVRLICSLLVLLSIGCGSSSLAQNKYNFSQFGEEAGTFFTQPIRWDGTDWLTLGLVGAGTFAAMQADQPIRDIALRDQRYEFSVPIEAGRIWGESYMSPTLSVALMLHGWITDNTTTKKIGFEMGQTIVYAAVLTQILSKSVGRARPNQNQGRASYQPFTIFGEDYHSLPGGHCTAAFGISTVLSRNFSSNVLKVLIYVPAVVTVVARVYQDYHWMSDDLLGAAIGYSVATWVVNIHDQKENRVQLSSVYPLTLKILLN